MLFVQYLLSNEVQIAYSATEGYVPVTTKASESAEYKEYLENGDDYQVKLDAKKLLLENVDNSFVTPVFNGSASLRNAAGQLIIEAAKDGRRKGDKVDDAYFEKLFSKVYTEHHLDQIKTAKK